MSNRLYTTIWAICKQRNLRFETEYRFDKVRRFRFDFAIPDKLLAVEYEGLMSSKSRHTTISGYSRDTEKYNLAAIKGWTVLRYTAKTVGNAGNDIERFLNDKTN